MAFNPNMANREVMNVVLLDYKSKVPFLNVDFANVSTTNFTANRVYARGGWGAPNRVGFDGERTGTLQIDTQIMPAKLFALLSGKDIEKSAKILKREELTAAEGGLTLSEDPLEGTAQVFAAGDDCGTPIAEVSVSLCTWSSSPVMVIQGKLKSRKTSLDSYFYVFQNSVKLKSFLIWK